MNAFLRWWGQHLLAVLPDGMRAGAKLADALVVIPRDEPGRGAVFETRVRRRGRLGAPVAAPVGRLQGLRGRGRLVLQAPEGSLLEREVVLPLAAEQAPEQVLTYELDRLTPFSSADAYWCWSVVGRDRARDRLTLRLGVLPRAVVAEGLAVLRQSGLAPDWIEVAGGDGRPVVVPMQHEAARPARLRPVTVAGGLCGALAAVAVVLPFVQQEMAAGALDREIAGLRPKLAEVEVLRRRIASAASEGDVVAGERARIGDALRGLATVTDILPDDSFLTEFTLKAGQLGLRGQSPAAARLIALFAADPGVRNPAFAAPVTRTDSGRADLFAIRADLAP